MQSYFTRITQIKEQLEEFKENVEEGEIVMNTLNGLLISWDSFIQGICAKRKLIYLNGIWKECTQEEARLITREEKIWETEDKALTIHTRRNNIKKEDHHHNRRKDHHHTRQNKLSRYPSNTRCYTYDEKWHYSIDSLRNKGSFNNKSNKKIHHAHTTKDDEPMNKRFSEEKEDFSSDEEYVLWSRRILSMKTKIILLSISIFG